MPQDKLTGIEELRELVAMFDGHVESFNDRWGIPQTIKLFRAAKASDLMCRLDQWPQSALDEALRVDPDHVRIDRLVGEFYDD